MRWLAACEKADWFDEPGQAATWTKSSQFDAEYMYGYWLKYLSQNEPGALLESLPSRVTPTRVKSFILYSQTQVRPSTVAIYADHWLMALRVLAPKANWEALHRIVRHLKQKAAPKPKRHRLVEPARLYQLGLDLMGPIEKIKSDPNSINILDYRDGLMIALLAARPIRRRTFTLIQIGKHLHHDGRNYWLSFGSEDIKNKRPAEISLPEDFIPNLRYFLNDIRLRFPHADQHNGLWPSMQGRPLSEDRFYNVVCQRTMAVFGHSVNPHLFRDCAATALATHAPDAVLAGADLLGHADLRPMYTHYLHAQTQEAGRAYQHQLESLRQRLSPPTGRRRGKQ